MSDFDLIIRGGHVVRPTHVSQQDIGIKDGKIAALSEAVFGSTDADLDASEFHLLPGLVDPHVHFHEPGRADWEGFEHGSRALAAGGVTSYLDMPTYSDPPVVDKSSFLAKWNFGKANSLVDFGLWGAMTPDNLGQLQELTECGVVGFKAYLCATAPEGIGAIDDGSLLEGMRRAADLEQIVAVHAENESITGRLARKAVAEGRISAADYLSTRPAIAELEAIQRMILFAWESDCALHVGSVSTARGVELILDAKGQGLNVSCEVCVPHLVLTEADTERLQALAKSTPPLRTAAEQAALWEQVIAGGVDLLGSGHLPTVPERKFGCDIFAAWPGIAGGQSTWPLMYMASLDDAHLLPLERLSELLSTSAARRFRLHPAKGEIALGADADLVIVKLSDEFEIKEETLLYRHPAHSPYLGRHVNGRVVRTILRGTTVFRDGRVTARAAARLLRPNTEDE